MENKTNTWAWVFGILAALLIVVVIVETLQLRKLKKEVAKLKGETKPETSEQSAPRPSTATA